MYLSFVSITPLLEIQILSSSMSLPSPSDLPAGFNGLFAALNPTNEWEKPDEGEVRDDREGEAEALLLQEVDTETKSAAQLMQLQSTLMNASKGVTDGTDGEYRRYTFYLPPNLSIVYTEL